MADGEAFGTNATRSATRIDSAGVEHRSDEFDFPLSPFTAPVEEFSDALIELLDRFRWALMEAVGYWHLKVNDSSGMILNHAVNDAILLVDEVESGAGRAAARTARALFEHLVHYQVVSRDTTEGRENAERYLQHKQVTSGLLARRKVGVRRLKGRTRAAEKERLARLARQAEQPMLRAIRRFGQSFRSQWMRGSLNSAAGGLGLSEDYDSYRVLSAVTHGSAGGLLGTRRVKGERVTHRLGPDLELVPFSFHEGLTWWRKLLNVLPDAPSLYGTETTVADLVDQLLDHYEEVFAVCRRIDRRTWPESLPPQRALSVLAVYPGRKVRWYEWDTATNALWAAELDGPEPPALTEDIERLEVARRQTMGGRPGTAVMGGVQVKRKPGTHPVHVSHILLAHDVFGPFRAVRVDEPGREG